MKVWITKDVLVNGIQEVEVTNITEDMIITIKEGGKIRFSEVFCNKYEDWHDTKESAIKKAEEMRLKKIENLKEQIEKLEMLKFE